MGATISHYRVLDRLGAGGMGEVYLAEDLLLGRKVALKVIRPGAAGDERAERRFLLEAQAAAQFDHPGICAVHEVGRDGEKTFIAMQYVAGETLAQRLRKGPLAVPELVTLAVQIAEALAEAHSRGVVHRDLKPGNVMQTDKGGAKLLDFGLARVSVDEVLGLRRARSNSSENR